MNLTLNPNEKIVKQWDYGSDKSGSYHLIVTDKRIIDLHEGGNCEQVSSANLDDISSLETTYVKPTRIIFIFFAIVFAVLAGGVLYLQAKSGNSGAMSGYMAQWVGAIGILFLVVSILYIIGAILQKATLTIVIYSKNDIGVGSAISATGKGMNSIKRGLNGISESVADEIAFTLNSYLK